MVDTYMTELGISLPGAQERMLPVCIEYDRIRGSEPTMVDPGSTPSVSICRILIEVDGKKLHLPWLDTLMQDDADVAAMLMEHWSDEDESERDRRDEDRAERRLERD